MKTKIKDKLKRSAAQARRGASSKAKQLDRKLLEMSLPSLEKMKAKMKGRRLSAEIPWELIEQILNKARQVQKSLVSKAKTRKKLVRKAHKKAAGKKATGSSGAEAHQ